MYGLGGGVTFLSTGLQIGRCTGRSNAQGTTDYSESESSPFHHGRDPIGAHIALLVNWNIFLQFFPILQPACLNWHPPCVERHGPQAVSLSESGVPCGCKQVAVNWLYEASWPARQAPRSPSSKFQPQSVLFCEPTASVVHRGKQQHMPRICIQTWQLPVDKKRQQATQASSKMEENLKHVVSTACKPAFFNGFPNMRGHK